MSASWRATRLPLRAFAEGAGDTSHPVKILGKGDISTKLTVRAHAFSASAKEKIEGAGGSVEEISD